jgi:hypothetical protein
MLFPRNALASGPQACFSAEKRVARGQNAKCFFLLTKFFGHTIKEDKLVQPLDHLSIGGAFSETLLSEEAISHPKKTQVPI